MSLEGSLDTYFASAYAVFHCMARPNKKADPDGLRKLVSKSDDIMSMFKSRAEVLEIESHEKSTYSLNDRFESFKATRLDSLDKYYTRTFSQLFNSAEITLNSIENLKSEFEKMEGNTKKHVEILLSTQKTRFKSLLQNKEFEHVQSMNSLREKIERAKHSAEDRIEGEVKRISDHFEKQIGMKIETLNMTRNASQKANEELKEMTDKRNKEMAAIHRGNNQILQKHQSSVDQQLAEEEGHVKFLMEKYSKLQRSHLELGPAIQSMWEGIKSRNEMSFANTDKLIVLELEEKLKLMPELKKKIAEIDQECLRISGEHAKEYVGQKECYEAKYNNMINNRESDINNAINYEKEKLDIRLHKMEQNLEKLMNIIESDNVDFLNKVNEKSNRHKDRISNMIADHKNNVERINKKIDKYVQDEINLRKAWKEERKRLNAGFDRDLTDLKKKMKDGKKFFEHKLARLEEMFGKVKQENGTLLKDYNDEIAKAKSEFEDEEREFSERAREELAAEIKKKVEIKMQAIKQKHREEIAEIAGNNKNSASNEDIKRASEVAQSPVVSSTFASEEFIGYQTERHRNSFINETKNLRQEEASALRNLDVMKQNYINTVEKTRSLHSQLGEAAASYEEAMKKLEQEKDEDIESLRLDVQEKERAIALLDKSLVENEKEAHRREQQIKDAEGKITELTQKLADEKEKIKNVIRKEYQPIIQAEEQKANIISSEIEKLRDEMELALEYLQSDLLGVETSNAAMEEDLRKETNRLEKKLRLDLIDEIAEIEEALIEEMNQREMDHLDSMNEKKDFIYQEYCNQEVEIDNNFERDLQKYKDEVDALNQKCLDILTVNSAKRKEIKRLLAIQCDKCPIFDKNIQKLEKKIVQLQYDGNSLLVEEKNQRNLYHTFKESQRLPPLTANKSFR